MFILPIFFPETLLQVIANYDTALFLWLNHDLAFPFLDVLMPWITEKKNMYLPGAIVLTVIFWRDNRRWWILLAIVLVILAADQLTSGLMKPLLQRERPCKTLEGFRLLAHCGSRYGFPSSHAANAAGITMLLGLLYRRWAIPCAIVAFLIGYSRIYVGVHYPLDVLVGWLIGGLIGSVAFLLIKKYGFDLILLRKSSSSGSV